MLSDVAWNSDTLGRRWTSIMLGMQGCERIFPNKFLSQNKTENICSMGQNLIFCCSAEHILLHG